jgi:hypothetical protein
MRAVHEGSDDRQDAGEIDRGMKKAMQKLNFKMQIAKLWYGLRP